MKLIYTNLGILTEERVRELKECGVAVQECGYAGSIDDEMHMRGAADYHEMDGAMEEPEAIVIRVVPEEAMLGEGGIDGLEGSPGYSGNQGATGVGPQGIPGSAASANPGGANVPNSSEPKPQNEVFNRRAEALLEAWMKEEKNEDDDLEGEQDELDVAPPYGKLTGADFKSLRKKAAHKKKHEEEEG